MTPKTRFERKRKAELDRKVEDQLEEQALEDLRDPPDEEPELDDDPERFPAEGEDQQGFYL